jgi:hypothetical protein
MAEARGAKPSRVKVKSMRSAARSGPAADPDLGAGRSGVLLPGGGASAGRSGERAHKAEDQAFIDAAADWADG